MAEIRVIRGACGISYLVVNGVKRYAAKTHEDGPFEYDDAKAERLVGLGVAEYTNITAQEAPHMIIGHLSREQSRERLETMKVEELKKLASDMNIDITRCKKKADVIEAIIAMTLEIEGAENGIDTGGADDTPTLVGAEDLIVDA